MLSPLRPSSTALVIHQENSLLLSGGAMSAWRINQAASAT